MSSHDSSPGADVRCVLQGVPWVGFYRGGPRPPEDDFLPSCVRSFLEWRGEDLGFAQETERSDPWHDVHTYLMGASGAAFRLLWDPAKWDQGADGVLNWSPEPLEPFTRALAAAGYGCEVLLRREQAEAVGLEQEADFSPADFRRRIVESIRDRGLPVIALGVVGPPECCLVTGYDDGGDALIGWSYFQGMEEFAAGLGFEPPAAEGDPSYFRKRDWFADTRGLILIGDRQERPPERELLCETLRYALRMMQTPVVRDLHAGQAAYTTWADELLKDERFPADALETLSNRHLVQANVTGSLAEARAWGSWYLRNMARRDPRAANELCDAAQCFDDEHDLVWAIWQFTGRLGHSDEQSRRLADAGTRGRIVPLIRLCRERDAQAAEHMAKALAILQGKAAQPVPPTGAVLQDVPKVGYGVHLCPFPGSLYAAMQYIGDPCEYDFLMGVTGAAFRRLWNRDDGGNVDLMYLQPEPSRRAFEALNYCHRVIGHEDRAVMLRAVKASIARGRPVLAFGIIGPPECGLVSGYEQDGEVLRGYSYFQDSAVTGYYTKVRWYEEANWAGEAGMIVVGDKRRWPGPSRRETLRASLRWAVDLARTERRHGLPEHVSGLAAYEAWAAGLEVDADYPADDAETMGTRVMVHGDQCVMLCERRSAAGYLRQMADAAPEAVARLQAAADLYEEVAALESEVWLWGCEMGPEAAKGLSDSQARRGIACAIRRAGEKEAEAVAHLEAALAAMAAAEGP